jgi:hypothetical protein
MSQKPNPFRRGLPVHVGDAYSPEYVREVVRWLSIENAFGDCWRISAAHLGVQAERYLADLVDDAMKGFLFVPFRISHRRIVGAYLIATPWTEAHLQSTQGMSAEDLRQSHRDAGVPDALADVLHLAAQAGARVLMFDADAPELDGLPICSDW